MKSFIRAGVLLCASACITATWTMEAPVTNAHSRAHRSSAPKIDKAKLEAYLRNVELWAPQIEVKIADPKPSRYLGLYEVDVHLSYRGSKAEKVYYLSANGNSLVNGAVYNLDDNPFREQLSKLNLETAPSFGPPEAPVTITVFSDFQCPFCKEEANVLRNNIRQTFPAEVRVVFKDFPLEAIHPWARSAAIIGNCVASQNKDAFWAYHDWIFEHQEELGKDGADLRAKVLAFAKEKQWDVPGLTSCIDSPKSQQAVDHALEEGRALQITMTPTLFVNGRMITGARWESLENTIRAELSHQQTAKKEAEKCCEVNLPTAGK